MWMDTEDLIGRYLIAAAEHAEAQRQLGEQSALARGNRAADELRRLAVEIGARGAASVATFTKLLDEDRNGVSAWAAFHVLEVMTAPRDTVNRAFDVIERVAAGQGVESIGARVRLRELRRQFGWPDSGEPTA